MDGDGGGDDLASPAPLLTLGDATPIPPWIPRANATVTLEPTQPKPCIACNEETSPGSIAQRRLSPPWSLLPHAATRREGKGAIPPLLSASPSSSIILWQSSVEPGGKVVAGRRRDAGGRGGVEAWMRCGQESKRLQIIHAQCSRLNVRLVAKL